MFLTYCFVSPTIKNLVNGAGRLPQPCKWRLSEPFLTNSDLDSILGAGAKNYFLLREFYTT